VRAGEERFREEDPRKSDLLEVSPQSTLTAIFDFDILLVFWILTKQKNGQIEI